MAFRDGSVDLMIPGETQEVYVAKIDYSWRVYKTQAGVERALKKVGKKDYYIVELYWESAIISE